MLVHPGRLQQVMHSILTMGQVFLKPGEVVEIETRPGDDMKHAMTVGDPGATKPFPACIVTWNEIVGDITIYADDADHLAAIADPVATALARDADEFVNNAVWLHCDRINSIRVGDVHVFFERVTEAKAPLEDEMRADKVDEEPDEWLASRHRLRDLKMQIIAEQERASRLGLTPRGC